MGKTAKNNECFGTFEIFPSWVYCMMYSEEDMH